MEKHILCVAYGGGHIQILAPVARELELRGYRVTVLALTTGAAYASSIGLPYKCYRDYLHLVDRKLVEILGRPLAEKMHNPDAGIPFEESVSYLGINVLENRNALGEVLADKALDKLGRHAFLPVEFMKNVIQEERADLVIATNSPKSETASLIAAEALGIPRIRIEDLFIEHNLMEHLKEGAGDDLFRRSIGRFEFSPSKICVMCNYAQKLCASMAREVFGIRIRSEDIVITGQPIFDAIDEVMKISPRFDLIPGREIYPTVTWAHQNQTPDEESVIHLLNTWFIRQEDRFNFIIKIHPNMNPDEVKVLKNQFPRNKVNIRFIHKELNANLVLWNSHVVVAQSSTMLTQASYMRKPVVVIDPEGIREYSAHIVNGLGYAAKNPTMLHEELLSLINLNSESRRSIERAIQNMGFRTDGTRNVANVTESLLNETVAT